jgi:hypothetical protein
LLRVCGLSECLSQISNILLGVFLRHSSEPKVGINETFVM